MKILVHWCALHNMTTGHRWNWRRDLGKERRCLVFECDDKMPPNAKLDDCNGLIADNVGAVEHLHQQLDSLLLTQHLCTHVQWQCRRRGTPASAAWLSSAHSAPLYTRSVTTSAPWNTCISSLTLFCSLSTSVHTSLYTFTQKCTWKTQDPNESNSRVSKCWVK